MKTIIEKILKTKIGTTFEHEVRENGSENFKLITYGKGITLNIGKTREKFLDKTFVFIFLEKSISTL